MTSWAGNLIWLARDKAGLSQRELAERAGTSQPAIAAYEAGRKEPAFSTLVRIIRAAGLDLRTHLVPYDDHDDWIKHYEASLPKEVVERARRLDRDLVEKARRHRRAS